MIPLKYQLPSIRNQLIPLFTKSVEKWNLRENLRATAAEKSLERLSAPQRVARGGGAAPTGGQACKLKVQNFLEFILVQLLAKLYNQAR
jgi:hypothetical protein